MRRLFDGGGYLRAALFRVNTVTAKVEYDLEDFCSTYQDEKKAAAIAHITGCQVILII